MQSASRRAFLTGRRTAQSPWELFCQRMRRKMLGVFLEMELRDGIGQARLLPKQPADVHHARALCAEYGIVLALADSVTKDQLLGRSVLWVDPARDLSALRRLTPEHAAWFVQPGCPVSRLQDAGLPQFARQPSHITVAQWLADGQAHDRRTGSTALSGITHASVLLADGTTVSLGAFGDNDRKPLAGLRLQRLVPGLFQLASSECGRTCRQADIWPASYRLDALMPMPGRAVNLAHLLLGHGGELGWVEWLVIEPVDPVRQASRPMPGPVTPLMEEAIDRAAAELDVQVKTVFDCAGLFPDRAARLSAGPAT